MLASTAGWAGCRRHETTPTPLPEVASPRPVQNAAPVLTAITTSVLRAEVNQDVEVTASVMDMETPLDRLEFRWTATAGTIDGAGPHAVWRLAGGAMTPRDVTIDLEVVERYADFNAAGVPVTSEHHVTGSAAPLRVHDSPAEIGRMALAFLVDAFGHSNVSPSACLVDFSDTCPGKAEELSDVEANRRTFVILDASARVASVTFNPGMTYADVVAPCTFHDRRLDNGQVGTTDGDCLLTAVYQSRRWWLCDSHFRSH